jgi:trans-aconitate 2-methyltransferase
MILWIDQPAIVPFLKNINDEQSEIAFRNEVISEMIELTKNKTGKCFETFRRINVFAKK